MENKTRSFSFSSSYETDLDDRDFQETEDKFPSQPLSSIEKLTAHRTNRSKSKSENENSLFDFSFGTFAVENRLDVYQRACELLDITADWQIRILLETDHIVLNDRSFSFNDIRALASAIDANLESFVLHSGGLDSRSIEMLCRGLKKCVHLNLLDLSANKFSQSSFDLFVETIENFSSLVYLSLIGCGIRDSSSVALGKLCQHQNLREINLSENHLEEQTCISIGNALRHNVALRYLNLSWNCIRNSACVSLFRGLEKNKTLNELDLSWNGVNYEGSVAIRRVLLVNKSLTELNISNCNIDWINAKIISEGLAQNQTLKRLNLAFNPLTTHGVEFLISGIKSKISAVSFLDVSGVTIFSTSARLGEEIGRKRDFQMKYDGEIPVHDVIGRQQVTKGDSMRKLLHHIDEKNWRTIDYFRVLDKRQHVSLDEENLGTHLIKSGLKVEKHDFVNIHNRLKSAQQPLNYKTFHHLIKQQRLRDRSLKIEEEKKQRAREKRHKKILLTAVRHFPEIEIVTRREKHREKIEHLAKPRAISARPKLS